MSHSPLMYGLIKLHAEIEGRTIGKRDRSQDAKNAEKLIHIRAVIRMVEPKFDSRRIKPKKHYRTNPWFKRGEIFLAALDVLREANEPLTQTEISEKMLKKRGVNKPDQNELRVVRNAIKNTLPRYVGKAVIGVGKNLGEPAKWYYS